MNVLTGSFARYLFAAPFAIFGLLHFMNASGMAGMVPTWIPGGEFWVYLTGTAMLAASVAIIIGKLDRQASFGLAALMGVYVLTIHIPGLINAADEAAMGTAMSGMLKDLGLAAGALMMAARSKHETVKEVVKEVAG
ncbi:MAG: DoxX family membrane protein [Bacteroidota bacterium]